MNRGQQTMTKRAAIAFLAASLAMGCSSSGQEGTTLVVTPDVPDGDALPDPGSSDLPGDPGPEDVLPGPDVEDGGDLPTVLDVPTQPDLPGFDGPADVPVQDVEDGGDLPTVWDVPPPSDLPGFDGPADVPVQDADAEIGPDADGGGSEEVGYCPSDPGDPLLANVLTEVCSQGLRFSSFTNCTFTKPNGITALEDDWVLVGVDIGAELVWGSESLIQLDAEGVPKKQVPGEPGVSLAAAIQTEPQTLTLVGVLDTASILGGSSGDVVVGTLSLGSPDWDLLIPSGVETLDPLVRLHPLADGALLVRIFSNSDAGGNPPGWRTAKITADHDQVFLTNGPAGHYAGETASGDLIFVGTVKQGDLSYTQISRLGPDGTPGPSTLVEGLPTTGVFGAWLAPDGSGLWVSLPPAELAFVSLFGQALWQVSVPQSLGQAVFDGNDALFVGKGPDYTVSLIHVEADGTVGAQLDTGIAASLVSLTTTPPNSDGTFALAGSDGFKAWWAIVASDPACD